MLTFREGMSFTRRRGRELQGGERLEVVCGWSGSPLGSFPPWVVLTGVLEGYAKYRVLGSPTAAALVSLGRIQGTAFSQAPEVFLWILVR